MATVKALDGQALAAGEKGLFRLVDYSIHSITWRKEKVVINMTPEAGYRGIDMKVPISTPAGRRILDEAMEEGNSITVEGVAKEGQLGEYQAYMINVMKNGNLIYEDFSSELRQTLPSGRFIPRS